jgi:HEAT repeats/Major Facilitator Superfamily
MPRSREVRSTGLRPRPEGREGSGSGEGTLSASESLSRGRTLVRRAARSRVIAKCLVVADALSQQKTAHALRHFSLSGALWAVYGPNATITGAVFTGFALSIGIRESQLAFLAAVTGLVGVSQVLSVAWTRRIANKRRFCVGLGLFEITFASLTIVIGLTAPQPARFVTTAALLLAAYVVGHTVSPIFANWMASVIPPDVRATYTGRRLFLITAVSAGHLFLASKWLDLVPRSSGFIIVFAVGWVAGILGYLLLAVTPFPAGASEPGPEAGRSLLEPLRERPFLLLTLFLGSWTLAMAIAGPFYSIYMLKYLHLSYMRIAVYTNLTLLTMLAGYRLTGPLAQRFGCKPVAKILVVPALMVPLLWGFADARAWPVLIPVACLLSGLAVSGLQVASSALVLKLIPAGRENSVYFAVLTACSAVGAFSGSSFSGLLKARVGDAVVLHLAGAETTLSTPQFVFLISAAAYLVPVVLANLLTEPEAQPAARVLSQFRGNLLGLAYNYVAFTLAREGRARASAIRGMAKSHSPLAVVKLSEGLSDVSPEVRQEAARGLGETRARDAIPQLVECLGDPSSDIRAEAADALGHMGGPEAVEALHEALADPDTRVSCSAALALGEIGNGQAREALVAALRGPFDPARFPSLVDAAGRTGDLRVVELGLAHLPDLDAPVLRMQIINSVCRALGERNHFYKLFSRRGLDRSEMIEGMTSRIARLMVRAQHVGEPERDELKLAAQAVASAVAADDFEAMLAHAARLAERVLLLPSAQPMARAAASAIAQYAESAPTDQVAGEGVVFTIVALTSLGRSLAGEMAEPVDSAGDAQ